MLRSKMMRAAGANRKIPPVYVSSDGGIVTTMPSHALGDIIIVSDYSSSGTPTLPSGWTNIATSGVGDRFCRVSYKIAASGTESLAGFDGNTRHVGVYRGSSGIGNTSTNTGTTSPINYPALTLVEGKSLIIAIPRIRNSLTFTAPTGMVSRSTYNNLGGSSALFDTDGEHGNWTSTNVSQGTNNWFSIMIELKPE